MVFHVRFEGWASGVVLAIRPVAEATEVVETGTEQLVEPLAGVAVEFDLVEEEGDVSVTWSGASDLELPSNFQVISTGLEDAALFLDVETTAQVSGLIELCLSYADSDPDDGIVDDWGLPEETLKILHEEDGRFVDRTSSRDLVNNEVCAEVESLSLFVLGGGAASREVEIDIKPGSFPNSINLGSGGTVPVAILSSDGFDATMVEPTSVGLSGAGARLKGKGTPMASSEDADGDGLLDLVVHVETQALELSETDEDAQLEGTT